MRMRSNGNLVPGPESKERLIILIYNKKHKFDFEKTNKKPNKLRR